MPSKRRGGFNPPELRGTLGTLLRTTTGVVRDALERGAREGRARLDDARANRRRHDALADLGALVLDLIRRGEIDLAELPEARDLVRQLDDLDAEPDDEPASPPPRPTARRRFDDRPTTRFDDRPSRTASASASRSSPSSPSNRASAAASASGSSSRASGSANPASRTSASGSSGSSARASASPDRVSGASYHADDHPGRFDDREDEYGDGRVGGRSDDRDDDRDPTAGGPASAVAAAAAALGSDGTVSSGLGDRTMRPTLPARPKHYDPTITKPTKGLWRDRFEDEPPPSRAPAARGATVTAPPATTPTENPALGRPSGRPPAPLDPARRGGISFDDDLEDYMHPDDVPPKPAPPPDDPDDRDP